MAPFNRTRTKNLSSTKLELSQLYNYLYNSVSAPCQHRLERTYSSVVEGQERIDDFVPVGKWKPGTFKVTEVQRFSVEPEWGGAIDAPIYFKDYTRCWMRKLVGQVPPELIGHGSAPTYLAPVVPPTSLVRQLGIEAAGKAQKPSVALGESFAEGGACLSMMVNPMAGLRKILTSVLSKRGGGLRNFADASSAWLEYRYGWTPLYNTIKDAFEQHPIVPDAIYNARASEKSENTTISDMGWFRNSNSQPWCLRCRREIVTRLVYRFQRFYKITDPALYRGFQKGGTIFQVPTLLWELVPLSFAIDWWLGIGDWLYAMTPNPSISILGNTFSVSKSETNTVFATHAAYPFPFSSNARWVSSALTHFTWKRRYYLRMFVSPIIAQPTLSLGYESWKHAIDALTLIQQRGASLIRRK